MKNDCFHLPCQDTYYWNCTRIPWLQRLTNQQASAQQSKCDPNTMDIGAANSKACYNCGKDRHFTKDCPKPINTCPHCKWLGGNHKKGCKKNGQEGHQAFKVHTVYSGMTIKESHLMMNMRSTRPQKTKEKTKISQHQLRAWILIRLMPDSKIRLIFKRSQEKPKPKELIWVFQESFIFK